MSETKRLFEVLISLGKTSKNAADDAAKEGDCFAAEFFYGERSAYRHIALMLTSKMEDLQERKDAEHIFEETI